MENHSLTSILCHSPMNTKEVLFNTYIETGAVQSGKCISEGRITRSDLLWNCTTDSDEIKLADDRCNRAVVQIMSRSEASRKLLLDDILNHGEF